MNRSIQIVSGVAVLAILIAPIGLGYAFSWVDFTYGAEGLDPGGRGRALLLVAAWIAGGGLFEWIFRRKGLEMLRQRLFPAVAFLLHLAVIALLLLPLLGYLGSDYGGMSGPKLLLYEVLLQAAWGMLYLRTGSFRLTGLAHGFFNAFRFQLVSDVVGAHETLYFYSASHPGFYAMEFIAPLCVTALLGLLILKKGERG